MSRNSAQRLRWQRCCAEMKFNGAHPRWMLRLAQSLERMTAVAEVFPVVKDFQTDASQAAVYEGALDFKKAQAAADKATEKPAAKPPTKE